MIVRKAFRYRIYPNSIQAKELSKNFGHARFVFNHFLAERKRFFEEHKDDAEKRGLNYYDTAVQIRSLKRTPAYSWLKEAHSQVLQQSLKDLDRAYQNFFSKRARFPRFHKKNGKQSIRFPQGVWVGENWINLPKIGKEKQSFTARARARSKM